MRVGLLMVVACLAIGCGAEHPRDTYAGAPPVSERMAKKEAIRQEGRELKRAEAPAGGMGGKDEPARKPDEKPQRKIIYTGDISLVVEDFTEAEQRLLGVIADHEGYIAKADVTGEPNTPRQGHWTIRVPAAKGDDFGKAVVKLGEMRRNVRDTRDITDQYHDLRAEMLNLEAREAALRELYKQKIAGSKLSELMEVDREINNVRGQINVRKGQIQRWDKETEFTTFTLTMYSRGSYVPADSPEFSTTLGRTFQTSLNGMLKLGKALVIAAVAVAPWLVLLAVIGLPLYFVMPKKRVPPVTTASTPSTQTPG